MKVRLLVGLSGPTGLLSPGDVYECDDSEATRLFSARYAIPYVEEQVERAVSVQLAKEKRDPLDHDGDGKRGGSLKGAQSTRAKGRGKK